MKKTDEMLRLEKDLADSPELKGRLYSALDRIAGEGSAKTDGELFEKAAAELGYQISAAELERFDAEREEIDIDEMEQVAGGEEGLDNPCLTNYECTIADRNPEFEDEKGHMEWCMTAWHCLATTLHTAENKHDNITCWSNYNCMVGYYCEYVAISPSRCLKNEN